MEIDDDVVDGNVEHVSVGVVVFILQLFYRYILLKTQARSRQVPLFQHVYLLYIIIKQYRLLLLQHLRQRNNLRIWIMVLLQLRPRHELAEHVEGKWFVITIAEGDQGAHDDVAFGGFNSFGEE